jgi:hypothetical protein
MLNESAVPRKLGSLRILLLCLVCDMQHVGEFGWK